MIDRLTVRYALDPAVVVVVLEVVQALALNDDNCPTLVNAVPGIVGAMERHPDYVELVTTAMTAMKNMMTVTDVQVRTKCAGERETGKQMVVWMPALDPLLLGSHSTRFGRAQGVCWFNPWWRCG